MINSSGFLVFAAGDELGDFVDGIADTLEIWAYAVIGHLQETPIVRFENLRIDGLSILGDDLLGLFLVTGRVVNTFETLEKALYDLWILPLEAVGGFDHEF